jgi:hypothetical protein
MNTNLTKPTRATLGGVEFRLSHDGKLTGTYRRHKIEAYGVAEAIRSIASIDEALAARAAAKAAEGKGSDDTPLGAAVNPPPPEEAAIPATLIVDPPRYVRERSTSFEAVTVRRWHRAGAGGRKILIYRADGKPDTVPPNQILRRLTDAEKAAYLADAAEFARHSAKAESLGVTGYNAPRTIKDGLDDSSEVTVDEHGFAVTVQGRRIVSDSWRALERDVDNWLIANAYPWCVVETGEPPVESLSILDREYVRFGQVFKTREDAEAYVDAIEAKETARVAREARTHTLRLDLGSVPG